MCIIQRESSFGYNVVVLSTPPPAGGRATSLIDVKKGAAISPGSDGVRMGGMELRNTLGISHNNGII